MAFTIAKLLTPVEVEILLAKRLKELRLLVGYKRSTLAIRSGVSEASLKRFETTGQASLKNVLLLAQALGRLDEFSQLFIQPEASSMAELRARSSTTTPKRGKI